MRQCRNPRCREELDGPGTLCPSCRLAARGGSIAGFVAAGLVYTAGLLVERIDWTQLAIWVLNHWPPGAAP